METGWLNEERWLGGLLDLSFFSRVRAYLEPGDFVRPFFFQPTAESVEGFQQSPGCEWKHCYNLRFWSVIWIRFHNMQQTLICFSFQWNKKQVALPNRRQLQVCRHVSYVWW